MPRYRTAIAHSLGRSEAIARLTAVSERARRFSDLKASWSENTFTFSVSVQGIRFKGSVQVDESSLHVDAQVPLVAMPFTGWIPRIVAKGLEMGSETAKAAPVPDSGRQAGESLANPVVLFLHIPKAGGSTLGEIIYDHCRADQEAGEGLFSAGVLFVNWGFIKEPDLSVPEYARSILERPDLRAIIGHFWFGIHEHLTRPWSYVTLLRNPVDRIVSLYHYLKLEDSMSVEQFVTSPPFKEVDNDQTRRISGLDPELGGCTASTLEKAKDNLRRNFRVAGITERFDESLVLMRRRLGWTRETLYYPRNVNPGRPATLSLTQPCLDAIRKRNELDFELYEFASGLLDEAIAAEGPEFLQELEAFRSKISKILSPALN